MSDRLTVACVLRSGGVYGPEYVSRLHDGVKAHLSREHRFCCLTDQQEWFRGIEAVPLKHDWPGWWSKIELFRSDLLSGRVLYFDLDTVIRGSFAPLTAYRGPFAMLTDFYKPSRPASGVMAWKAGVGDGIYHRFVQEKDEIMARYRGLGDQGWISEVMGPVDRIQDFFPGVRSYKVDGLEEPTSVLCFHGEPKPHELSEEEQERIGWAA